MKPIFTESPEAAVFKTDIAGWVSSKGVFFGNNQSAARQNGATHMKCIQCGATIERSAFTLCDSCRAIKERDRYNNRPRQIWNGIDLLYSETANEYYSSLGEIEDDDIKSLRLVICKPYEYPPINPQDLLAWDEENVPDDLERLMTEFNERLADMSSGRWEPGPYAAIVGDEDDG